jgi:hypothetical protein
MDSVNLPPYRRRYNMKDIDVKKLYEGIDTEEYFKALTDTKVRLEAVGIEIVDNDDNDSIEKALTRLKTDHLDEHLSKLVEGFNKSDEDYQTAMKEFMGDGITANIAQTAAAERLVDMTARNYIFKNYANPLMPGSLIMKLYRVLYPGPGEPEYSLPDAFRVIKTLIGEYYASIYKKEETK